MTRTFALVLTLVMLLIGWTPTLTAEDLIIRKDGKTTRVLRVTKATFSEVSFILKEGLQEQSIDRENVRRIRFGDTPASYTAGVDFLRKGEFERAIKAFKEARTDPNVRSWWAGVWCQLNMADAYLKWAQQTKDTNRGTEAVNILKSAMEEFPDSFYKPDFQSLYVEALIAAGDPKKAKDEAEKLENDVASWADKSWYMNAKLLGAEAMLAAKLYTEAISKLDTLVTFARTNGFTDAVAHAQVLKADAILAQGNKDRALSAFRDLVTKVDSTSTNRAAAAAYIGLGRVLLEHFDDPDQARENLLIARVLYFGSDKKDYETMAEAAYWLGRANEELARKGEAGAKIEAMRYYREIVEQYRTTSWINKATEQLKKLGG